MQPTLLNNETCVYCGAVLSKKERTKEHVIGRRFVPTGVLANSWNLIVWACGPCNNRKSSLEDDLSAISMQPNAWGQQASDDDVLRLESERKARNSFSSRTGRSVANSVERIALSASLGPGVKMSFNLTAPPQADSHRIFELARMQLMAFFYWLTFDEESRRGRFWPGKLFCLIEAQRKDWGNVEHVSFMRAVVGWETRLIAPELANGFFRVAIRRHPAEMCFCWAFEWNKNFRILGFFGEETAVAEQLTKVPRIKVERIHVDGNSRMLFRTEVPLQPDDDVLFHMDPEEE